MPMPSEDSKQIEDQVMTELRSALELYQAYPPTSIISIPKVVKSPPEGPDEGSLEDEETELLVKVKDPDSPSKRTVNTAVSLDGSMTMSDSFMMRLSSSASSGGGSSLGMSESSQRFYIGTVKEEGEECSIQSHVSNLGTDDMSHGELMDVVHRLYDQLKKADEALARERKRRHSREKNLIKLAKELGSRKDAANKLLSKIEEMREELRMMKAERELLEQRLELQKRVSKEIQAATQAQADRDVRKVADKCKRTIAEHDERIEDLNRTHAVQCEQLCREVVEANQEIMRLQKVLTEMTRGAYPVDQTFTSTVTREALSPSKRAGSVTRRSRRVELCVATFLFLAAVVLGYNIHSMEPAIRDFVGQIGVFNRITTIAGADYVFGDEKEIDGNRHRRGPSGGDPFSKGSTFSETDATKQQSIGELLSQGPFSVAASCTKISFKWIRSRLDALRKATRKQGKGLNGQARAA